MATRRDLTARSPTRLVVRMRSDVPLGAWSTGGVPSLTHAHADPSRTSAKTPIGSLPAEQRTAIYAERIRQIVKATTADARVDWLFAPSTTPGAMEERLGGYETHRKRPGERDLFAWFEVEAGREETELLLRRFAKNELVAEAYRAPAVYPPPAEGDLQRYRQRDIGVNAVAVASATGGLGQGVRLADIEYGWGSHAELPSSELLGIEADIYLEHGTHTLGVVASKRRPEGPQLDAGCIGIAAKLDKLVRVGQGRQTATGIANDLYNALTRLLTTDLLRAGDVVLIEAQSTWQQQSAAGSWITTHSLPVDAEPLVSELVRELVNTRGFVVVEAAGNNNVDLGAARFRPQVAGGAPGAGTPHRVGTSGALIVGGTVVPKKNKSPRRMVGGNYGTPVDAWAWGDGVYTCALSGNGYTDTFGGTSAAAAIVAGVVAVIQGLHRARHGTPATSAQIRAWLRDPALGTDVIDTVGTARVGTMPDLGLIAREIT